MIARGEGNKGKKETGQRKLRRTNFLLPKKKVKGLKCSVGNIVSNYAYLW